MKVLGGQQLTRRQGRSSSELQQVIRARGDTETHLSGSHPRGWGCLSERALLPGEQGRKGTQEAQQASCWRSRKAEELVTGQSDCSGGKQRKTTAALAPRHSPG